MNVSRRKHVPLKAQLHAALYQLGLDPRRAQLDHAPALALRDWDDEAQDTRPPASDPRFLRWLSTEEHKVKTFGSGATTAGSDIGTAAKLKRMEKSTAEFTARLLAKSEGREPERKSRWPKRSMRRRA